MKTYRVCSVAYEYRVGTDPVQANLPIKINNADHGAVKIAGHLRLQLPCERAPLLVTRICVLFLNFPAKVCYPLTFVTKVIPFSQYSTAKMSAESWVSIFSAKTVHGGSFREKKNENFQEETPLFDSLQLRLISVL